MNPLKPKDISPKISKLLEDTQYFDLVRDIAQIYMTKYAKEASIVVSKIMNDCDISKPDGANMRVFWKLVQDELELIRIRK